MFLSVLKYCEKISCGYNESPAPTPESELLLVSFLMEGDDHCGYCSGEEADIHQEEVTKLIETSMFKPTDFDSDGYLKPEKLSYLNKYNDGCTTTGSGYCIGFYQLYKALKAHKIKIEKL
jgi:hypothetical protein